MPVLLLLRRVLAEPVLLRRAVYVVAAAGTMASVLSAPAYPGEESGVWVIALTMPVVALGWWLERWRAEVFAAATVVPAVATSGPTYLWPLVAALTLLAVVEDRRPVPVVGWVGGLGGSVLALIVTPYVVSVAQFLAVGLGGGIALLVRSRLRVVELEEQAEQLETQTVWLEQRTALARELHDVVGHHVTAMVVQAEAGLVGDPERALTAIGGLGRSALTELDALVVHLRDPDAPLAVSAPPRLSDVDELLAAPLRLQGVAVGVRIPDDLDLDERLVLTVYRIAQEALTNVARHAQATAASVEVVRVGAHLRVRVSDDGIGVPAAPARGSGLVGIEERVAAQGGSVELVERLGGGTVVDVVLPLERPLEHP